MKYMIYDIPIYLPTYVRYRHTQLTSRQPIPIPIPIPVQIHVYVYMYMLPPFPRLSLALQVLRATYQDCEYTYIHNIQNSKFKTTGKIFR